MEESESVDLCRIERVRNRTLCDPQKVFENNAWDDVVWNEEQLKNAEDRVLQNSGSPLPDNLTRDHMLNADKHWNNFYKKHNDQFFKDRKWLNSEFPEILAADDQKISAGSGAVVFETGCGAGSTVFPILSCTLNTFVYCCDFAEEAIRLLKTRAEYDPARCCAFVGDITDDSASHWPVPPASVDFLIMLFTLSAIRPERMAHVVKTLASLLKPGGIILFRDYGKYDLAQLRFKKEQCAGENLYIRQDGTLAYFFTQDEIRELFSNVGLIEKQNAVDRRLIVNRKKNLLMHRVWIQCKFVKPNEKETSSTAEN